MFALKKIFVFFARIGIVYGTVIFVMYMMQNSLIYHPNKSLNLKHYPLDKNWQRVTTQTQDNLWITSWHLPAKKGHKTILYLQGNAGDILNRKFFADELHQQGYGVYLLGYRGFANNPGTPSEQGLFYDTLSAYAWLMKHDVSPENLIVYGESLGAANAIKLAQAKPVAGLVLDAPFYSLLAMAKKIYPFLPVTYLLKDKYLSYRYASAVKQPVLVFYGLKDNLIPYQQVNQLMQLFVTKNKWLALMPEQTHEMKSSEEMVAIITVFDRLYFK